MLKRIFQLTACLMMTFTLNSAEARYDAPTKRCESNFSKDECIAFCKSDAVKRDVELTSTSYFCNRCLTGSEKFRSIPNLGTQTQIQSDCTDFWTAQGL